MAVLLKKSNYHSWLTFFSFLYYSRSWKSKTHRYSINFAGSFVLTHFCIHVYSLRDSLCMLKIVIFQHQKINAFSLYFTHHIIFGSLNDPVRYEDFFFFLDVFLCYEIKERFLKMYKFFGERECKEIFMWHQY